MNIKNIDSYNLRYQAYSSFYTKNYHHSRFCLETLHEKNALKANDYNFLAYLYARHNEKDKAISTWCNALEKNKNNKLATKALSYVREKGSDISLIDDEFFDSVVPSEPFVIPIKKIILSIIIILFAIPIFWGIKFIVNFTTKELIKIQINKNELNNINLPDFNPNLLSKEKDVTAKYSYSENEIKNKFDRIKKYIITDKANQAQLEINQIKLSNASINVKLKMDMLINFINEPDYANFINEIKYEDVLKEPILYQNIYILWTGKVVNLIINKESIKFDFIMGDDKNGIITGIIPVYFKKAIIVKNNEIIKVFGKINIDDKKIFLNGLYIIKNINNE